MAGQVVLVVDGGGTKTDVLVARVSDKETDILSRNLLGPCNVARRPISAAINVLDVVYQNVKTSLGDEPIAMVIMALAGLGDRDSRLEIERWLEQSNPNGQSFVFSDIELAFQLGEVSLSENQTIVSLISGTGSIAMGRGLASDEIRRAGGWGHLLGDEGSGFWIGRSAIRAVAMSEEGRGPQTRLTEELFRQKDVDSARQLIQKVFDDPDPVAAIAGLTPSVVAVSRSDEVANSILVDAGSHLAKLVIAIVDQTGPDHDFSLALSGSVICQIQTVQDALRNCLQERGTVPSEVIIIDDPAIAAVEIAKAVLAGG